MNEYKRPRYVGSLLPKEIKYFLFKKKRSSKDKNIIIKIRSWK